MDTPTKITFTILLSLAVFFFSGCSNQSGQDSQRVTTIHLINDLTFADSAEADWNALSENQRENLEERSIRSLEGIRLDSDGLPFTHHFRMMLGDSHKQTVNAVAIKDGSILSSGQLNLDVETTMDLFIASLRKNVSTTITIEILKGSEVLWQKEEVISTNESTHWHPVSATLPAFENEVSMRFSFKSDDKGLFLFSVPTLLVHRQNLTELDKPNVILISLDTVRADHLGHWGYHRETTPFLDSLAAQSLTFKNAYAQSGWTTPSHKSILSGFYPQLFDYYSNTSRWEFKRITNEIPFLQNYLRQSGYYNIAFTGGAYVRAIFGFFTGFDRYIEMSDNALLFVDEKTGDTYKDSGFDQAIKWLEGNKSSGPYFMFLHTYAAHQPYAAPGKYDQLFGENESSFLANDIIWLKELRDKIDIQNRKSDLEQADIDQTIRIYDRGLRWLDDEIAKVITTLKETGQLENTIVVVLSDHGELFFEHYRFGHITAWNTQLHVPLMIYYPRLIHEGRDIDAKVELVDVAPTILDLVDLEPANKLHGTSLFRFLERGHLEEKDAIFASQYNYIAVSNNKYRFQLHHRFTEDPLQEHFYNIEEDPGENNNLIDADLDPEAAKNLMILRAKAHYYLAENAPGYKIYITDSAKPSDISFDKLQPDESLANIGRLFKATTEYTFKNSPHIWRFSLNLVPETPLTHGLYMFTDKTITEESMLNFTDSNRVNLFLDPSERGQSPVHFSRIKQLYANPAIHFGLPENLLEDYDVIIWKTTLPFSEQAQFNSIFSEETENELRNMGYLQ